MGRLRRVWTMGSKVAPQRRVFLTAADQKLRIAESLERAGIHVVDDILAAPELLRVTIGASKGVKDCGTYNNVRYALRADGEDVVSFAVEGWTGSCVPNVFDDLSERLASEIASKDRAGGERSP